MHKVALGTVVLAVSLLVAPAAYAQMKVTSDDIKNGAKSSKARRPTCLAATAAILPRR